MNGQSINPSELKAIGGRIIGISDAFESAMNDYYQAITELGPDWTGGSAQAYTKTVTDFKPTMERLRTIIKSYGEGLIGESNFNSTLDQDLASSFRGGAN